MRNDIPDLLRGVVLISPFGQFSSLIARRIDGTENYVIAKRLSGEMEGDVEERRAFTVVGQNVADKIFSRDEAEAVIIAYQQEQKSKGSRLVTDEADDNFGRRFMGHFAQGRLVAYNF